LPQGGRGEKQVGSALALPACAAGRARHGERLHAAVRLWRPGMVRALIFDCDGVLADTERYGHLPAFNQTFAEFHLTAHWSEEDYGEKLKISGGKERMASLLTDSFVRQNHLPTDQEGQRQTLAEWHKRKTAIYTDLVAAGRLPGRPGVAR